MVGRTSSASLILDGLSSGGWFRYRAHNVVGTFSVQVQAHVAGLVNCPRKLLEEHPEQVEG